MRNRLWAKAVDELVKAAGEILKYADMGKLHAPDIHGYWGCLTCRDMADDLRAALKPFTEEDNHGKTS